MSDPSANGEMSEKKIRLVLATNCCCGHSAKLKSPLGGLTGKLPDAVIADFASRPRSRWQLKFVLCSLT